MTLPLRALATAGAALVLVAGLGVALLTGSSPDDDATAPRALASASCAIGFQNGMAAAEVRMRRLDPGGFNATRTGAWDKAFASWRKLIADHDAACAGAPPPTTTTQPPPTTTAPAPLPAPQTYNKGSRGQDAKYCVNGGAGGTDAAGYRYDSQGLELDGRRTGNPVPGLKPSDEMDGRGPCDPYNGFPPWPAGSYER